MLRKSPRARRRQGLGYSGGPKPHPTPAPVPAPAAVAAAVPVPLAIVAPEWLSGFRRPEQPPYGGLVRPGPAQDVAMLEAGEPVVRRAIHGSRSAAVLLTQLTAAYVEDARRGSPSSRSASSGKSGPANQAASPLEMLVGATQWNGPGGKRGNVPRKFEEFARTLSGRAARREGPRGGPFPDAAAPPCRAPGGAPVP